MVGKSPLLSKTLWFNALAVLVAVAKHYGFAGFVPSEMVGPLGIVIVGAVDIALRLITHQPIVISPSPADPAEPTA